MQSWEAPHIPLVPGDGVVPRLLDTVTGDVVPVAADGTFTMYVCGITPYDAAHIGHAATYVTYDTVQRVARDAGLTVTYVQNITDVDDPLLERAARDGHTWHLLAEREIARFREDMQALAVIPPDRFDGVVESMPLIIEWIEDLRDRGAAYRLGDDWYYSVAADAGFGGVAGLDRASMLAQFAERGGDPAREGKKDPLDALLWAGRRPGEPWWESSLGPGRPGWHVECVAIAEQGLGPSFDLQGGGSDLVFPHHEMCASIARASGSPFARVYSHVGMVALDGEKMSKSKGNLEFVGRLRDSGHDPRAVRLAIQAHHYRRDWEWSPSLLVRAEERLARWSHAVARSTAAPAEPLIAALRTTLADDLRTPDALAAVDAWAAEDGADAAAPGAVRDTVDALLGVTL